MTERKTISLPTDPGFLEELSDYLEALSNPVRLKILKFIEQEPREITVIADHAGLSYQTTKKHLDRLVGIGLVQRAAGFGRETDRGIAPVWKYSLADGGLKNLARTLEVFSNIATPLGYSEIAGRIRSVKAALGEQGSLPGPVLYLIGGRADGRVYVLDHDRVSLGRGEPGHLPDAGAGRVVVPDEYGAVTRVTKPHAYLVRSAAGWDIEDNASTGGTFLNSKRLEPGKKFPLASGDVIDLSLGAQAARFLFIADT